MTSHLHFNVVTTPRVSTFVPWLGLEASLAAIRQEMADLFGEDTATAVQTPQGQIAGILAVAEAIIGEALVKLGAATSVDDAVGVQLDALGSLLDILRVTATRSTVTATVTGVGGTGLPQGSRAKTADGAEFRTTEAVTLAPSPGIMVDMEAVEEGAVEAAAGALTQIVTVVPGWETITNASAARVGQPRQADPAYRNGYRQRTAHRSVGNLSALESALEEAIATKYQATENFTNAQTVVQDWAVDAHHILVVAQGGTDGDIRRAVENYRGMGVGTMVGIVGGTADNTALDSVSNGTVNWNGTDYTGLDLTTSSTAAAKAATLTTLLSGTGVTVRAIDGVYVAEFGWQPNRTPDFGDGTVIEDFGLQSDVTGRVYPVGPFARPRDRALTIDTTVTRQSAFPADGLAQIRAAVNAVIAGYDIGETLWYNDVLSAIEGVRGTRVTVLTIQHNSVDVSGVAIPLDAVWTLAASDLTITLA